MKQISKFSCGQRIDPRSIKKNISVVKLKENHFQAFHTVRFATREGKLKLLFDRILGTSYRYKIPVYTSLGCGSLIDMNVSAALLFDCKLRFDSAVCVHETAANELNAKNRGEKSGLLVWRGISSKSSILRLKLQIQEVLHIIGKWHDSFVQVMDANPDGGRYRVRCRWNLQAGAKTIRRSFRTRLSVQRFDVRYAGTGFGG
ncbi:MAG: hypothetical protein WAV76_08625, partial [Bacteroidota bacterium]